MLVRIFALVSPAAALALCWLSGDRGLSLVGHAALYGLALFLSLSLLFVLFAWICSLFVDQSVPQTEIDPFYRWLTLEIASLILFFSSVHIRASGLERIPADRPFLLVSNHRSNYDPIVAIWVMRRFKLAFVSKPSNLRLPIVGNVVHKCCFLPIDREDDRKALTTILAASDLIKNEACSVCIYPEGTRNKNGLGLLPFKAGAFKIAQRTFAPVVVAATDGSERIHRHWPLPTTVRFTIADVITQSEGKRVSTQVLSEKTQEILCKTLHLPLPESNETP